MGLFDNGTTGNTRCKMGKKKEQELEDLKKLPLEERIERLEKFMQNHTHAGLQPVNRRIGL